MKNQKKLKILVLFDVGGVQIELDFENFYKNLSKLSKNLTSEQAKDLYLKSKLDVSLLKGEISDSQYANKLEELFSLNRKISKKGLERIMESMWKGPITKVIELKKRIYQNGYSIGIFSNTHKLAVELVSKKWPDVFDVYNQNFPKILSFKIKDVKPNPKMYEIVKKYGDYKKIIFIDDNEAYLKTGIENFGWFGIHFTVYIDSSEPIRYFQNYKTINLKKNFRTTNSLEELTDALKEFGIEI